jgi:antitoxin VapB
MTSKRARAKVFWSGGSQAVRLPKEMRLSAKEVTVTRRGKALVIEEVPEGDNWDGFWESLVPLRKPIRRWPTRPAERRKPF